MRYAIRLNTVSVVCEHYEPDNKVEGIRADQPGIAAQVCQDLLQTVDPDGETFGFLVLDDRHHVSGFKLLTMGTRTQAPVDGAKLFRCALAMDARGIILFHNHPSGDLAPSRDDLDLTRRLVLGGTFLGISVHDHIICTPDRGNGGEWISLRSTQPDLFAGSSELM
jgi:DNA repair protein RadC